MKKTTFMLFIFLCSLMFSSNAFAVLNNNGVLDSVTTQFYTAATTWGAAIYNAASYLFWLLAAISMVWTFGFMALRKADIGEFFAEFLKFTIVIGFFRWLLENGTQFASDIILSLRIVASNAAGVPNAISPSGIVDVGFAICFAVIDNSSLWNPVDTAVALLLGIVICVVLALIAVNMVTLLCSSWFLLYGGIFFLGFGGSKWTSDMAINYYKTVLKIAIQLFAMILLVGTGQTILSNYHAMMSASLPFKELVVMLIVAIVLYLLVNKIPELLASVVTGGMGSIPGGGGFGGGAALGAAALAASAIASGGASLAGGASAIQSAVAASKGQGMSSMVSSMGQSLSSFANSGGGGGGAGEGEGSGDTGAFGGGSSETSPSQFSGSSLSSGETPSNDESNSVSEESETAQDSTPEDTEQTSASGTAESSGGFGDIGDDVYQTTDTSPESTEQTSASGTAESGGGSGETEGGVSQGAGLAAAPVFAASVLKNLVGGIKDVAKEKMKDRLSETTGGRIAAAIDSRAAESKFKGTLPSVPNQDEISSFVNKKQ